MARMSMDMAVRELPPDLSQALSGAGRTVLGMMCRRAIRAARFMPHRAIRVDVQKAVNDANDGSTVIVPAGLCVWNSHVRVNNKNMVILGAGADRTILDDNQSGYSRMFLFDGLGGKPFRLSGFKMKNIAYTGVEVFGRKNWRIDNCDFEGGAIGVHVTGGTSPYGLVDHCGFFPSEINVNGDENGSWLRPLSLGTADAVYAEDNVFREVKDCSNDAADGRSGGRLVFRYNTLMNQFMPHVHGIEGGGFRGMHSYEFYGNTVISDGTLNCYRVGHIRGGTGVVYDNTWLGSFGRFFAVHFCAPCTEASYFCQGFKKCTAYPFNDQIGRTTDHDGDGLQDLVPLFEWNNSNNGEDVDIYVQGASFSPKYSCQDSYVMENRDFYNDAVAFDPQSGMYTATYSDANVIKNWSYRPYPYPHPLALIDNAQAATHTFTVLNSGSGAVAGTGIICGTDCAETFAAGTAVALTATPSGGFAFAGWSGSCSGTGICNVVLNKDTTVSAAFGLIDPLSGSGDSDADGIPDSADRCQRTAPAARAFVNRFGCAKPLADKFDIKPDFEEMDLNGMPGFEVGISAFGKISYAGPDLALVKINPSGEDERPDLDRDLGFSGGTVRLDADGLPMLAKPATITLYNIAFQNPRILRDGVECSQCRIVSYGNRTLVFRTLA